MRFVAFFFIGSMMIACASSSSISPKGHEKQTMTRNEQAQLFVDEQTQKLRALLIDSNKTWFEAATTGTDAAFEKSKAADQARDRFLSNPDTFAKVKAFKTDPEVTDPLLKRELEVLYLSMVGKQVDPSLLTKITNLEKKVEQAFNTFRGNIRGKEVTQNEINQILGTSTDSNVLKAAWEAQKSVGPMVEPILKELVVLRNQMAKSLGFRDFYALVIETGEQNEEELLKLFDELDRLTEKPFLKTKAEVDKRLAKHLGVRASDLMPWHYQNAFFQESPDVFHTGLQDVYKNVDILQVSKQFFSGMGLEVDPVLAQSDLYEKKGKSPHAFAINIDREGDVRVLANIVPGFDWQSTMVHELGHAMYDVYLDKNLPWLLREAAHPLTTEGIAMMLDSLVANPRWAEAMGIVDTENTENTMTRKESVSEAKRRAAFDALLFSRWTQVMLRFERAMYANPDQDLNTLWWDLVEQYQSVKKPVGRDAPDYASKIHFVVAPVYYHNYMLGKLFACQVHEAIAASLGKDPEKIVYVNQPAVGEFLKTKVFAPGHRLRWDELTQEVTGKVLSAEAFARQFSMP